MANLWKKVAKVNKFKMWTSRVFWLRCKVVDGGSIDISRQKAALPGTNSNYSPNIPKLVLEYMQKRQSVAPP